MSTPLEPSTVFIRRGELLAWLRACGVGERQVRQMISAGTIKRVYFRPCKRAHFSTEQVRQVLYTAPADRPAATAGTVRPDVGQGVNHG